jgi:tetratricopeptide (TPR) repeat protein
MKKYRFLPVTLLVCLSAFAQVSLAQMSPAPQTTVKVGLLNARAKNIVVPKGAKLGDEKSPFLSVTVALVIDETGKVTDAKIVDGNYAHRVESIEAAKASTFLPYLVNGKPAKMSGTVVYEFDPMEAYTIGEDFMKDYSDLKIAAAKEAIAKKDYETAIKAITDSLLGSTRNPEAYYLRGNAYAATGRNAQAAADYRSALTITPGNAAYKQALAAVEKPTVTPKLPVAKRADVMFADLLEKYGEVMDNKYEPKDAEYNDAKKQALAQKAAIAGGKAKGPLDTSNVCRILGELRLIDGDMFDYYDLLDEMYSDGDVKDYPELKLRFQDYQELQEVIDADLKNEPAFWGCSANSASAAKLTPLQILIKGAAAEGEVDKLMAEFDKTLAKLVKGLAAKDANASKVTRAVNCNYYDVSKKELQNISNQLKKMDADTQRPYVKGRAEFDKRLKAFNLIKRPENCTLFV